MPLRLLGGERYIVVNRTESLYISSTEKHAGMVDPFRGLGRDYRLQTHTIFEGLLLTSETASHSAKETRAPKAR